MCNIEGDFSMETRKILTEAVTAPKVFTSYWNNKQMLPFGFVYVAICQYPPRFFGQPTKGYKVLAPTKEMLAGLKANTMSLETFDYKYKEMLAKLDAKQVYNDLLELGGGKSVIILCYEKPPLTCHRHMVAKWLEKETGEIIYELPYKK